MELIEATTICSSRGIKVEPIQVKGTTRFKIQINERGKVKTYSKEVKQGKEPAEAQKKVYIKIAKEIINE